MELANRTRIGILFTYFAADWIGGHYYLINIINSLNSLPDVRRPHIFVFYDHKVESSLALISYPYVTYIYHKAPANNYLNYVKSWLSRKNFFIGDIIEKYQLKGIYPLMDFPLGKPALSSKVVSWFPDFQHRFYPEYFSKINIFFRELRVKRLLQRTHALVLSSQDAYNHLKRFYDVPASLPVHILRFVSQVERPQHLSFDEITALYQVPKRYFIVSNQFYIHKNHWVVLKALEQLKQRRNDFIVVFTGKEEDYKVTNFVQGLKDFVTEKGLSEYVRFLGVIPRTHQLYLMSQSIAVVQPSKFEGWSTVVEDAKTLQVQLILSDIDVHQEQMQERGFYFSPDDVDGLIALMEGFLDNSIAPKPTFDDFEQRISTFANTFVQIFQD
ncbi:MAG: glycosyltransferase family 4 protein [Bacteroidetes bacterium]|nr:glycosyltransferase family 4 protein [Bacteroidota bacterium]